MGAKPARPVTTKDSGDGVFVPLGLRWGFSGMQGWRKHMEDAHLAMPSLNGPGWGDTALFGVMDGHGGAQVAEFCEKHLPAEIASGSCDDIAGSMYTAFLRMDEMLLEPASRSSAWSFDPRWTGCTAVLCCVRSDVLVVANAGDSRAVLCRAGQAVPLSEDHKPEMPFESARIVEAGGYLSREQVDETVMFRINGDLNVSRSIGDLEFKQNHWLPPARQIVTAAPDVYSFWRSPEDEFMVIACDGIWEVLSSEEVVCFVQERLKRNYRRAARGKGPANAGLQLSKIMEDLLDECLSPNLAYTRGWGGDNMTALLVVFDQPHGERHWASRDQVVRSWSGSSLSSVESFENSGPVCC